MFPVREEPLLLVQIKTRIVKVEMRKGFAECGEYHSLPFSGESEIPHNDYRCSAGVRKKRAQDLLPKGRGSILRTGPGTFSARASWLLQNFGKTKA